MRFLTTSSTTFFDWLETYEAKHGGEQAEHRYFPNGCVYYDRFGVPIAKAIDNPRSGHTEYHVYSLCGFHEVY